MADGPAQTKTAVGEMITTTSKKEELNSIVIANIKILWKLSETKDKYIVVQDSAAACSFMGLLLLENFGSADEFLRIVYCVVWPVACSNCQPNANSSTPTPIHVNWSISCAPYSSVDLTNFHVLCSLYSREYSLLDGSLTCPLPAKQEQTFENLLTNDDLLLLLLLLHRPESVLSIGS